MLSILSVSVSRVMLSIQSFAAGLHKDPKWLLSHAELSRVRWRKGSHDGELIVEIESAEPEEDKDLELGSVRNGDESPVTHKAEPRSFLDLHPHDPTFI